MVQGISISGEEITEAAAEVEAGKLAGNTEQCPR
jgi:hypothetical protein